MHQYRYERSRKVGKQYIELFLLIKPVIIKLERKRKKTKKNICTNLYLEHILMCFSNTIKQNP